jgi:hypothetical protein
MVGVNVSELVARKFMTVYWLMFLIPLIAGMSPINIKENVKAVQWFVYGFVFIVLVGLRHKVGGDWDNYIIAYAGLKGIQLSQLFSMHYLMYDPGYLIIHWISLNVFNNVYFVNLICAIFFVSGLLRLSRSMPIPWLALIIGIPYLTVVVSMGYTRQGAAIGIVMWALVDLMNDKRARFYILVICAVLIHKSALMMLIIGSLYTGSFMLVLFALALIGVFSFLFIDVLASMVFHYFLHTNMESSGALVRISMSVLAAFTFIWFRRKWDIEYGDAKFWMLMSIIITLFVPLAFISSTMIDRLALYFIPMQIIIFSRIPRLIQDEFRRSFFVCIVITIYLLSLFTWLNFGSYSKFWIPYQNILTL